VVAQRKSWENPGFSDFTKMRYLTIINSLLLYFQVCIFSRSQQ